MMQKKLKVLGLILTALLLVSVIGCRKKFAIEFETETIDFGTMNSGESKDIVFKFKNTGREVLKLWEIRPTCGCTEPDEWDQEVLPGESGQIKFKFHTQAFREEIAKVVYIKTNVPERATVQLTIKGYIYHILEVNPKAIYVGEVLEVDKPFTRSFIITNNQGKPLELSQIVPPENTTVFLTKMDEEKKYQLDFTVHPPFVKEEEVTRKILIKTGESPDQNVELSYSYFVPPPIQVNPKEIGLDMEKVSYEKIDWRINIRSNIEKPIAIQGLRFDGTGAEVFIDELNAGNFYQVAVQFPVGFTFPENQDTFTVSFRVQNDPRGLLYSIPIRAEAE